MALRPEMIDFIWLDFIKEVCQLAGVGKVSIVQEEEGVRVVRILIQMINPLCMIRYWSAARAHVLYTPCRAATLQDGNQPVQLSQ